MLFYQCIVKLVEKIRHLLPSADRQHPRDPVEGDPLAVHDSGCQRICQKT